MDDLPRCLWDMDRVGVPTVVVAMRARSKPLLVPGHQRLVVGLAAAAMTIFAAAIVVILSPIFIIVPATII